jgi:hypothetical protein
VKTTVAVCITVIICVCVAVGGLLSLRGMLTPAFFQILASAGTAIGVIASLVKSETTRQAVDQVVTQTNGTNTRLQKIADVALARHEPAVAAEILAEVDGGNDTATPASATIPPHEG